VITSVNKMWDSSCYSSRGQNIEGHPAGFPSILHYSITMLSRGIAPNDRLHLGHLTFIRRIASSHLSPEETRRSRGVDRKYRRKRVGKQRGSKRGRTDWMQSLGKESAIGADNDTVASR